MTLNEAFILTCHTRYVADAKFLTEGNPSQEFLDRAAQLLERDVYLEEFFVDQEKILTELKTKSYDKWMEIVNESKED